MHNLISFMHQMKSNKLTQEACLSVISQILRKSTLKLHDISLDLTMDCINVSLYFNDLNAQFIETKAQKQCVCLIYFRNNAYSAGIWNRNTAYFQPLLCLLATSLPLLLKHFFSIYYSIFKFKSVTKYFAQDIVVIELIAIYDSVRYKVCKNKGFLVKLRPCDKMVYWPILTRLRCSC